MKMPGTLDIDLKKVKRKIKSAPGTPKLSPSSPVLQQGWVKAAHFGKNKKKSTPNLNLTNSRLELRTDYNFSSLSDDDSGGALVS